MLIVGLLGGVASGKSLIARQLCELGAGLLDGDRAGHEVLQLPEIERQVRAPGATPCSPLTDGSIVKHLGKSYSPPRQMVPGSCNASNN